MVYWGDGTCDFRHSPETELDMPGPSFPGRRKVRDDETRMANYCIVLAGHVIEHSPMLQRQSLVPEGVKENNIRNIEAPYYWLITSKGDVGQQSQETSDHHVVPTFSPSTRTQPFAYDVVARITTWRSVPRKINNTPTDRQAGPRSSARPA